MVKCVIVQHFLARFIGLNCSAQAENMRLHVTSSFYLRSLVRSRWDVCNKGSTEIIVN
jgi:predicted HD phosphohydrolase